MKKVKNIKLEIIVFVSGAVVMVFEIVGSRVMSPYLGNSTFVWTSLIGVILGALSLGYYLGGKLADKKADTKTLSLILFSAGVAVLAMNLMKDGLLYSISLHDIDLRVATVYAGIMLFGPTSVLLGIVSPYTVKLKLESIKNSGKTVGELYALSTLGSIFGTFSAGFYLIAYFGTNRIIYMISLVLILLSIFAYFDDLLKTKLTMLVVICLLTFVASRTYGKPVGTANFVDIDTNYSRVHIYDVSYRDNRPARFLVLGKQAASAMYLDGDDLTFSYTNYYNLFPHFKKDVHNTLLIGGAAYSYPKCFLAYNPEARMDVVEIDPGVTKLASEHFKLDLNNPRLTVHHQDARIYLNENSEKYDVIFMDAFDSPYSLPIHLTTTESISEVHDSLVDDGIFVANIITGIEGEKAEFFNSYYKTLKVHFPYVYAFPYDLKNTDEVQNIVLIATKTNTNPSFQDNDEKVQKYLSQLYTKPMGDAGIVLTDDFAPVEHYISKLL